MKKFLGLVIVVGILFASYVVPVSAVTASELSSKIESLRNQYPNGTHQSAFYNSSYYYQNGSGGPCYKDLSGWSSWECMAWACKVYDTLWESSVKNGSFHQNAYDVYIGDYVRFRSDGWDHSIVITNIVGDTIYYTDCNGVKVNGVSRAGKVQWDRTMSKSDLQTKINQALYGTQFGWSYGHIVHYPNNSIKGITEPWLNVNKTSLKVGEPVQFSFGTVYGTGVHLAIDKDGERYINYYPNGETTYEFYPAEEGHYTALVSEWTHDGYLGSPVVSFDVTRQNPWLEINKKEFTIGEAVQFSFGTVFGTGVHVAIDKDGERYINYYPNGETTYMFYPTEDGHYTALVSEWTHADYLGSPVVSFAVKKTLYDDFYAKIVHSSSGMCLTNDSANVSIRSDTDDLSQWWHFIKNSEGTYKIVSLLDNRCLDVDLAGTEPETNIKVADDNNGDAQKWDISGSQEKYVLKANCTDCVIDIQNGTIAEGNNVWTFTPNGTDAQLFTIEPHQLGKPANLGDDFYANIYNSTLDMYVTNNNKNVSSNIKNSSKTQQWHFKRNLDGSYTIQSHFDNDCMDVDNYGTTAGVNIKIEKSNNDTAQKWYLYKIGEQYCLRAKCTQCVLDIANSSILDGANIQTNTYSGAPSQMFQISKMYISKIDFDPNGGSLDVGYIAVHSFDYINASRGENQLVLYTGIETTGTNQYGYEVVVDSSNQIVNVICEVGNANVPHGGFVLSGHGTNFHWLKDNCTIGGYVTYDDDKKLIYLLNKNQFLSSNKQVVSSNKFGELPIPEMDGFVFDGWYTKQKDGIKITSDTDVDITSDTTLYAQWKTPTIYTSSKVIKAGNTYTIDTKLYNYNSPCEVFVVGYKNKRYVTMQRKLYIEEDSKYTLEGDIDEIKVLVWEELSNLKPLCEAEVILPSEWIVET